MSAIGMPSIHSTVRTRFARALPVDRRGLGTVGISLSMLSAISEMAAASSRRSISISVVWRRLSTTATGLNRREGG